MQRYTFLEKDKQKRHKSSRNPAFSEEESSSDGFHDMRFAEFHCLVLYSYTTFSYLCGMTRRIQAYGRHYSDFMKSLSEAERLKIQRALLLFTSNERIPAHYIKYIRDGVYEFRVTHGNNEFRIFFCYDGDTLVILFNGIRKKTQKLRNSDIEKAVKLKNEYYGNKEE